MRWGRDGETSRPRTRNLSERCRAVTTVSRPRPARKPVARSIRWVRRHPDPEPYLGVIRITVGEQSDEYDLVELECGITDASAYRLEKRVPACWPAVNYDVLVEHHQHGGQCECLGFLRHGRCKHIDGIRALVAVG